MDLAQGARRRQLAELGRFLLAGFSAVGTDWLGYVVLVQLGAPPSWAKATSFVLGAVVSFCINRAFTFHAREGALTRQAGAFAVLYAVTLGLNVAVNALALRLDLGRGVAFFLATGSSTVANFLGMKFLVFRTLAPARPTEASDRKPA